MQTIVEPQEPISSVWGQQQPMVGTQYRLMRYVIATECDGHTLFHNVVTGELVVLEDAEMHIVEGHSFDYIAELHDLVAHRFLVPVDADECAQVINLRRILRTLYVQHASTSIVRYVILPTTACNARCYYCFEQGSRIATMTEQTADDVVKFIAEHCGSDKEVYIIWFGGEPTMAAHRIDRICEGLQREGITYQSEITTNGYLLDEQLAQKAVDFWHVGYAMICLDGAESTYNRVKAYSNAEGSPYQTVLHNVSVLLGLGVRVLLRMNVDLHNYAEFDEVMSDIQKHFGGDPNLSFRVHPLLGCHADREGCTTHASDGWYERVLLELDDRSRHAGLLPEERTLKCLHYRGCVACNDTSITITPWGALVECPEQYDDTQSVGTIWDGITHPDRVEAWKVFANYPKCIHCPLFPSCAVMVQCNSKDGCNSVQEQYLVQQRAACSAYIASLNAPQRL